MPRTVAKSTASTAARGFGLDRLWRGSTGGRERFGKYRLLGRLAVGGMAEIHLARVEGPQGFEKLVVLKRMLQQHARNREMVRMFLDEARLMAGLTHPNITQVYDFGKARGSYFFTMEYVHGEDAGAVFAAASTRRESVPLEHAVAIVAGAAAGLHYAHGKTDADGRPLGIVHRDVTPSNVLVSYDGSLKITDFGVAKWAAQSSETRHGTLKGKFPYMSPEQTRGEPLDPRSDVFALGILLFELTTGTRLYEGASDFAVLSKIVNEDAPPPSTRRPDYPPELERVVIKALRRSRDERFGSAQELQLALEEIARERRLNLSPVAMARYMEGLFDSKVEAWRTAKQAGQTLAEHLVAGTQAEAGDDGLSAEEARLARSVIVEGDGEAPPDAEGRALRRDARTAGRRRGWRWGAALAGVALALAVAGGLASSRRAHEATVMPVPEPKTATPAAAALPLEAAGANRAVAGVNAPEAPRAVNPEIARRTDKRAAARRGERPRASAASTAITGKPNVSPSAKPAPKAPKKWDPDSVVPPS